jgi:predicted DNA-binding ribbon-helix-helix protein
MKSPVVKRSIVIAGHKTSVSLEDAFWKSLKDIASRRAITLSDLVASIDTDRRQGNLSSAIRLFVLDHDRAQSGDVLPLRLEALLQSLSEKIEQVEQSRSDQIAVSRLEDCIAKLVERLNATDSRLNNLDAIERGLADLLVHIEDIRTNKESTALRAENSANVDLLKQDMARTHGTLEAVHGTLGQVADRLAIIEKDIRADRPEPAGARRANPPARPDRFQAGTVRQLLLTESRRGC